MLNGAGFLAAADSRIEGSLDAGGLLQVNTYLGGLSEGGWLVGSIFANNFSTVINLRDGDENSNTWELSNSVFEKPAKPKGIGILNTVEYWKDPNRKINVIFAVNSSANTNNNWPNGTAFRATAKRSREEVIANGTAFSAVPDAKTFINLGLNRKPTFFGCDTSEFEAGHIPPLIVYIPNTPYTYNSNYKAHSSDTATSYTGGPTFPTETSAAPFPGFSSVGDQYSPDIVDGMLYWPDMPSIQGHSAIGWHRTKSIRRNTASDFFQGSRPHNPPDQTRYPPLLTQQDLQRNATMV
ncbi:hypothetical protein DL766_008613 [Monosporascus sp. MC13-8B]|uniref:Lysophospholipase n=1 Tax=Monosporascus cannonballus TaxID=155416 RepID=A0ABY0GXL5_9PEZI|nr:hypothetical protein DL762_008268 [Monosporascus cannonballus]RYO92583.1 hypothetical protein DL763_004619 [Monosporascus cannonballus]RYP18715.1 hypothetical protein DL766_008613 [Monosporascus sp. MC13-8B]